MKIDGFVKIPDIPGESMREGHEDEIEIHGLAFGMEASYDRGGSVARGRVDYDPVVVTKYYDRSSPALKAALATHRRVSEAVVAVRRAVEGEVRDYLVITLADAAVVRYELAPAPDQVHLLEERVALAYRTITFRYDGQHEVELEARSTR